MKKLLLLFVFTSSIANAQWTPSLGLVARYPFDGDANDYSGNNNHGTVYGATLTTDRFNNPNSAYSFDGIDDYIQVPSSVSFNSIETNSAVTITAWINIRAWYQNLSHFMMLERHEVVGDNGWGFAILKQPAEVGIFYAQDMSFDDTVKFVPTFNTWYHVAVSWNMNGEDSTRFYINGVKIKSQKNLIPMINTNNGGVYIGRSIVGIDEYSDGKIDELGVYNRTLKDSEILQIYQGCQTPSITSSPSQTVLATTTTQFTVASTNTNVTYQWQVDAGFGFLNLSNAGQYSGVTSPTLTVSNVAALNNNNVFRCVVSGCGTFTTGAAMLTVNNATGISKNLPESEFSIYPNPTNNKLTINTVNNFTNSYYTITNLAGKVLLQGQIINRTTDIHLYELVNGFYFVNFIDESGNHTKKVIKN